MYILLMGASSPRAQDYDKRVRKVRRVLERLIPASGLTDQNWEIHVIDDPQKNAFVIPG